MIERTKSSAFGAAIGGRAKSRTAGRSAVCEQIQLSLRANCRVLIWGQIGKTKKENALRSLSLFSKVFVKVSAKGICRYASLRAARYICILQIRYNLPAVGFDMIFA